MPWLVLKRGRTAWLLIPAAIALALFAWLLTLHSSAAGRTYAAYGGMYITVALAWLYLVQGIGPTRWDMTGAGVALVGMAIIALQPSTHNGGNQIPSRRRLASWSTHCSRPKQSSAHRSNSGSSAARLGFCVV